MTPRSHKRLTINLSEEHQQKLSPQNLFPPIVLPSHANPLPPSFPLSLHPFRYAGQVEWRVNAFKNAVVSSTASSPFCWEDVEKFVGGDLKTAVGRAMEKSKRKGKKTSGGGKAPEKEEGGSGENSQDGGDGGMGVLNMFNKGGKGGGKGWNLDVYVRVMKGIENGSRWEVKEGINDGVWNEDVGKRCEGERRKGRNFKVREGREDRRQRAA